MTKWGSALERLRKHWTNQRNSIGELCRRAQIERSEYYRICHASKLGPSAAKIATLLTAMGMTWYDWAAVLEGSAKALSLQTTRLRQEGARGHPQKDKGERGRASKTG